MKFKVILTLVAIPRFMSIATRISTFCITAVFIYLVNLYLRLTVAELFYFTKLTSDTELDVYNASI